MKWEYLRVEFFRYGSEHASPNKLYVIGPDGNKVERVKQKGDGSHIPVVSRLLAELGDQGWELTGVMSAAGPSGSDVLYFKRPKP